MAKPKTVYACTECGGQAPKWQGQCPRLRRVEHAGRERSPRRRRRAFAERRRRALGDHAAVVGRGAGDAAHPDRAARSSIACSAAAWSPGGVILLGRRSRHRQVDAAAAGGGRARRRAPHALRDRRGVGRADRAARAAPRAGQRAGRAARRGAARSDRRGDRRERARGRRHRLDPDDLHRGADLGARQRRAGPRMRGAADAARQAARHRRRSSSAT